MNNNIFNKIYTKLKNKLNNKDDELIEEYKFSTEEIEDLNEQNKQKIELLKQGTTKQKKVSFTSVSKKLDGLINEKKIEEKEESKNKIEENLIEKNKIENKEVEDIKIENNIIENDEKKVKVTDEKKEEPKDSYINLTEKSQEIVMNSWKNINLTEIDKDIIEGKEILNHNYNITYGDSAARFVHNIRKKYEIVICYLIGFNNEKKGIPNKTILSDRVDDEWKYLSNYIKLLEKIRSFRK